MTKAKDKTKNPAKKHAKGKHPGGAPTKCTPALIKKAEDYLENYKEKYKDNIPSVVGLAIVLKVRRETLHVWAKDETKPEISNILKAVFEKQENVLINNGLDNTFNSSITKLVLGKHGYHDKQDTHVKEFFVTIGGRDADTL